MIKDTTSVEIQVSMILMAVLGNFRFFSNECHPKIDPKGFIND